jgi:hypothetical protein
MRYVLVHVLVAYVITQIVLQRNAMISCDTRDIYVHALLQTW